MAQLELENIDSFRELEGKTLPAGDWLTVTQEMIIHVDVEKAAKYSPFKKPVAHGFMSLSLLAKLLKDVLLIKSVKMGVNYGLNKVRFPSPVLVDSRLRLISTIQKIENYGDNGVKITWNCVVETDESNKPACVAEFISLMFE